MDYKTLNDYELISYINENNEEANNLLIKKYEPLIAKIANKMIISCPNTGIDINDLIQEGRIGLNHAISYFDSNKDITFYTYAKKCIERKMISVIIATKRLKHKILNESISYDIDNDDYNFENLLKDNSSNPENIIINSDSESELIKNIKKHLTDFEKEVFELLIASFNYKEIAIMLDKDKKQVDNAIQRIKNKVKLINRGVLK